MFMQLPVDVPHIGKNRNFFTRGHKLDGLASRLVFEYIA